MVAGGWNIFDRACNNGRSTWMAGPSTSKIGGISDDDRHLSPRPPATRGEQVEPGTNHRADNANGLLRAWYQASIPERPPCNVGPASVFLSSAAARTSSLAGVFAMKDPEVEARSAAMDRPLPENRSRECRAIDAVRGGTRDGRSEPHDLRPCRGAARRGRWASPDSSSRRDHTSPAATP